MEIDRAERVETLFLVLLGWTSLAATWMNTICTAETSVLNRDHRSSCPVSLPCNLFNACIKIFLIPEADARSCLRSLMIGSLFILSCVVHYSGLVLDWALETGLSQLENAIEAGVGAVTVVSMLACLSFAIELSRLRSSISRDYGKFRGALQDEFV